MEVFVRVAQASIREIHNRFSGEGAAGIYERWQTVVYRLEGQEKAVRARAKVGNFHMFLARFLGGECAAELIRRLAGAVLADSAA